MVAVLAFTFVSALSMTFLVFVEWKKGAKNYLKISPYLFFAMTLLNYILIPIANIV